MLEPSFSYNLSISWYYHIAVMIEYSRHFQSVPVHTIGSVVNIYCVMHHMENVVSTVIHCVASIQKPHKGATFPCRLQVSD